MLDHQTKSLEGERVVPICTKFESLFDRSTDSDEDDAEEDDEDDSSGEPSKKKRRWKLTLQLWTKNCVFTYNF